MSVRGCSLLASNGRGVAPAMWPGRIGQGIPSPCSPAGPRCKGRWIMSNADLNAAARGARSIVSRVAAIRGLLAAGVSKPTIARLERELNVELGQARAAIYCVKDELRGARSAIVRLGDFTAPTAHEMAVEMVYAINRKKFGVEIVGSKQVQAWPEPDEVLAEIELELTKAKDRRTSSSSTNA